MLKPMLNWTRGYSKEELDAAQERYGLIFPPDLVELLQERRPRKGYDWRHDDEAIKRALSWPLEGLIFDIENNDLWWSEWGERPASADERAEAIAGIVAKAPALVPILGHRYIPAQPHERGNPVFSVYQSDIIYYGSDLADYFDREFQPRSFDRDARPSPIRRIEFWSDLVDRNW